MFITVSPDDEAAIRSLENNFVAAFNSGDVDAIMKSYIPDSSLIVFDVVPRKQYRGADAYRKVHGKWLIALEHVSVPVDMATGKASPEAMP